MNIADMKYQAAESVMEKLGDVDLSPIIKKMTDEIYTKLATDFENHLISDAQSNVAFHIQAIVDSSVKALLSGDKEAMKRYPLSERYDADVIRQAIALHCGDEVLKMRIEHLEKELKQTNEALTYARIMY